MARGEAHFGRNEDRQRFVGLVPELLERCGTVSHGLMRSENPVRLRVGTGDEVLSPRWGWVSFVGRNPALTHWATGMVRVFGENKAKTKFR